MARRPAKKPERQIMELEDRGGPVGGIMLPQDGEADDAELVKTTLRDICRDPSTPAAARAQAARTLAEMTGLLGRFARPSADPAKPITEMTREELERELAG